MKGRVERLVSAGGVVTRNGGKNVEVVLCRRDEPPRWSLPKGTPDRGETIEETAVREVQEETGLEVQIERPLDSITYWFVRSSDGCRCHKTVNFYLMTAHGGSLDLHDHEFDEVRWMPADEALKAASYPNEARIMGKALAIVSSE